MANLRARLLPFFLGACLLAGGSALADAPQLKHGLTAFPIRPPAPDLALRDIDNKTRRLSALRGKVILVNFWATWCPPCRREMPSIEHLSRELKGADFEVLAVNVGESLDTVFSFTGTLDPVPTFPIVFDSDGKVLKSWPVRGLPTTFLIDKKGRIAYRAVGGREFDDPEILAQIRALIAEPSAPILPSAR